MISTAGRVVAKTCSEICPFLAGDGVAGSGADVFRRLIRVRGKEASVLAVNTDNGAAVRAIGNG
ncbi:hypothetical protein BH23ACT12_BH23ACT12_09820 [soil metagenome]